jgi:hypothetical protein
VLRNENIVIGGDLNFTTKRVEVWGNAVRMEPLGDCFLHKIKDTRIVVVEPLKFVPIWCGFRS